MGSWISHRSWASLQTRYVELLCGWINRHTTITINLPSEYLHSVRTQIIKTCTQAQASYLSNGYRLIPWHLFTKQLEGIRGLHRHASCWLVNIHIMTLLPSIFYGERCYGIRLYAYCLHILPKNPIMDDFCHGYREKISTFCRAAIIIALSYICVVAVCNCFVL